MCGRQKEMQRGSLFRLKGSGCKFCNHREEKKRALIGQRIDRITVVAFAGANEHGQLGWRVRCDCGIEFECRTSYLRRRQGLGRMACNSCLRKMKNEEYFWSHRVAEMRGNAKKLRLKWELSDQQARAIMEMVCTYCGSPQTERRRIRQDKPGR